MPARRLTVPLVLLLAVVLTGLGASGRYAGAALQDATPTSLDATPATGETPTAEATPAVADEASPVAEPEEPEQTNTEPVTLVFAYVPDESGDFLVLATVSVDGLVLTRGEPRDDEQPDQVDFESPRNDGLPWIRYRNNVFEAYAPLDDPGLLQRWVYFDEDPEARPSTLVLQIVCVRGEYDGFEGTATFVSRGGDAGGTLILALEPPEDGQGASAEDEPEE